jgi:hypothetical protein
LYVVDLLNRPLNLLGGSMSNEYYAQFSLERQRMLEEAIERAENNQATQEDFDIIRTESGLKRQQPSYTNQMMDDIFQDFAHIFGGR